MTSKRKRTRNKAVSDQARKLLARATSVPLLSWPAFAILCTAVLAAFFAFDWLKYYVGGDSVRLRAHQTPVRLIRWDPALQLEGRYNLQAGNFDATVSQSGDTIVFAREVSPNNADIFIVRRIEGGWSRPERIPSINTPFNERYPYLDSTGKVIYFSSDRSEGQGGYDLYASYEREGRWTFPDNLGEIVNSDADEIDPSLDPDGLALYFASNIPDAEDAESGRVRTVEGRAPFADFDLYKAWPDPLGTPGYRATDGPVPAYTNRDRLDWLNTEYDEGRLTFTRTGDGLFFHSNRVAEGAMGGYDIYKSLRVEDKWIPPQNLGGPVNTRFNERYPTLAKEGFELYFASNRTTLSVKDYSFLRSPSREVVARLDYGMFRDILLALLLLGISGAVLSALLRLHQQGKMALVTRCLLASLLAHLLIGALSGTWFLSTRLGESLTPELEQWTVSVNNLARESVALAVRESVAALPTVQSTPTVQTQSVQFESPAQQAATVQTTLMSEVTESVKVEVAVETATSAPTPRQINLDTPDPVTEVVLLSPTSSDFRMETPEGLRQEGDPSAEPNLATLPKRVETTTRQNRSNEIRRTTAIDALPSAAAEILASLSQTPEPSDRLSGPQARRLNVPVQDGAVPANEEPGLAELLQPPGSASTSLSLARSLGILVLPSMRKLEELEIEEEDEIERLLGLLEVDPNRARRAALALDREAQIVLIQEIMARRQAGRQADFDRMRLVEAILSEGKLGAVGALIAGQMPLFILPSDSELEIPENFEL